jgi:hypothetical protein
MSHLTNFPKVRVRQVNVYGYIVEVRSLGITGYKWNPIVTMRGADDTPYIFLTRERAIQEATRLFMFSLMDETNI